MANLIDIKMPQGDQETGKNILASWLVSVGSHVKENEPIIEISTDKVNMEIAAPKSGTLIEVLIDEGRELRADDILGRIEIGKRSEINQKTKTPNNEKEKVQKNKLNPKYRLSPIVKRLIKEYSIDVNELVGTARIGRISKADVLSYLAEKKLVQQNIKLENKYIAHDPMRKSIADHMVNSLLKTAPHVTSIFEMDLSSIIAHRKKNKDDFSSKDVNLTFTSYFVYASVQALKLVPEVNSRYHDDGLELFEDINIGIGTALEDKGIIVPVIKKTQELTFFEIAQHIHDLTNRARQNKLNRTDVLNGTFTISNHGVSGSLIATPIIINQPQSAILGIGKMEKRVKVVELDGVDQILIKPMAFVTLSIDHRVLDAYHTNAFLSKFVEVISHWDNSIN